MEKGKENIPFEKEGEPATPTGRSAILERLKSYNPEGIYDTDDDMYGALTGYLEDADRRMEEMNGKMNELADIFRQSPQVASFFIDLIEGKENGEVNLYRALARNFGADLNAVLSSGGAEAAAYDEGLAENEARNSERRKREEEFRSNADAAMAEYEQWLSEEGMTPEDRAAFEEDLVSLSNDMGAGKFMRLAKALNRARRYDNDVESARAEGEIRGRNSRIAEERTLPRNGGDGLPNMEQGMGRSAETASGNRRDPGWEW